MVEYVSANQAQRDQDRQKQIVTETIREFGDFITDRSPLNAQCEEVASLILPSHRNTFYAPGFSQPYTKKTDQQIDSTGMVALSRYMAIMDSMLTPQNALWSGLAAGGKNARHIMKDRASRMWFYNTNQTLFRYRYSPISNYVSQNQGVWTSNGAFGNGVLLSEKFYDIQRNVQAIRYIGIPFGQIYLKYNHQGLVDGFIRMMRYKARQAMKVPEWQGLLPQAIIDAADKSPMREFIFLQHVYPRDDYHPERLDAMNMPYASCTICMDTQSFIRESGYRSLPIALSQYENAPGEENARSPAMAVLPSLKTLNAQKRVFLKQGHRAGDPIILMADDGIANMNMKPGAQNKGAWSSDGKPLVGTLPAGEIQITLEMMQEEQKLIDSMFLTDLFRIALERKSGTTATEIVDEINKRGILIAPSMGRQQQYLARGTERDLDLLGQMGALEPMPPLLREARGEYQLIYLNPLARSMRAGEVGGFMRTVGMAQEITKMTGDPSYLDPFDFDTALPEVAWINGSPEPWMADADKIASKRQARAKAAQTRQQIDAAPGAAALIQAQAKAQAAGAAPAQAPVA